MQTVYITIGLPGSGKTTWAKEFIKTYSKEIVRVNNDDIRKELFGEDFTWDPKLEDQVKKTRIQMISDALKVGHDIIVDNTHINTKTFESLKTWLKQNFPDVEIVIKDFRDVPLDVCIMRDALRGKDSVGEKVIRDMARQGNLIPEKVVYPMDENLPWTIICDLDGTLALFGNRRNPYDCSKCDEIDEPNNTVLCTLQLFLYSKVVKKIHFFTGREEKFRSQTERFLENKCDFHFKNEFLIMRATGDKRPDEVVKQEMFDNHIKNNYNVLVVIDDRPKVVRMWHSLGLPVFNVGDGHEF